MWYFTPETFQPVLPTLEYQRRAATAANEIGWSMSFTIVVILVCELLSLPTVRALRSTQYGRSLHNWAIISTLFNFLFVATPIHTLARL